jgi:uncharacterized protein YccT (UPF0319 family)
MAVSWWLLSLVLSLVSFSLSAEVFRQSYDVSFLVHDVVATVNPQ